VDVLQTAPDALKTLKNRAILVVLCTCVPEPHAPLPVLDVALVPSPPTIDLDGKRVLVDTGATVHGVRGTQGAARARVLDAHGSPLGATPLSTSPLRNVSGPWFGVNGLSVPIVISPQAMLAFGQSIELDFPNGHLRMHDDPKTSAALVAHSDATLSPRCTREGVSLFVVDAIIAGDAVHLLIDSGSARTSLSMRSAAVQHIRTWPNYPATLHDPSGDHRAWVVLGVPIFVGEMQTAIDLVVADDPGNSCGADGALGVDLLTRCNIVLMRAAGGISCR